MPAMGQVDINEYTALRVRVAELEAQVAFLMRHLNVQYVSPDGEFMDKLKKLAQSGKILEAIKLYREKTGASLEEAKRYFGV